MLAQQRAKTAEEVAIANQVANTKIQMLQQRNSSLEMSLVALSIESTVERTDSTPSK